MIEMWIAQAKNERFSEKLTGLIVIHSTVILNTLMKTRSFSVCFHTVLEEQKVRELLKAMNMSNTKKVYSIAQFLDYTHFCRL